MANLLKFERAALKQGTRCIAGVDEAGRGPLAGPVVAAAVVLAYPVDKALKGIRDSKLLTPEKRDKLFDLIKTKALYVGVGIVSERDIETRNILQATFLAMRQALQKLSQVPDLVLVDGPFEIPDIPYKQKAIIKGDRLSLSIGAASIIAKVTRDRLMEDYDHRFPQYGFARHKGYGTQAHMKAIQQHGPCEIHRMTFAGCTGRVSLALKLEPRHKPGRKK